MIKTSFITAQSLDLDEMNRVLKFIQKQHNTSLQTIQETVTNITVGSTASSGSSSVSTITIGGDAAGSGTTSISLTVTGLEGHALPALASGFLQWTGSAWAFSSGTFPIPVPVADGGTGTTTVFTQGSLIFAGASGVYSQDNANLNYLPTGYSGGPNLEFGPRGSNPLDASYEFYVASGVTAHFHNINPTQSITGGVTVGLMYVPTGAAVTTGNRVGSLEFGGSYNVSDNVGTIASIRSYAQDNLSSTTLGGNLVFQTVPSGTATLATALTIGQDQSSTFAGNILQPSATQFGVFFCGASGLYTQDPTNFIYNPTGFGGATPTLQIGGQGSNPTDAHFEFYVPSGVTAHFHNVNTTQSTTGGVTVGLMYVPTGAAVTSGNRVASLEFGGSYNTSDNVGSIAAIRSYAQQNLTSTTLGGSLVFQTVPNGSATLTTALTIGQDQSATFTGTINATTIGLSGQLQSTVATGTAPFTVASVTPVANLNIGGNASSATTANGVLLISGSGNQNYFLTFSTSATGSQALITSSNLVYNASTGVLSATSFTGSGAGLTGTAASLTAGNASQLLGSTWASPAAIGSTTPAAGSFTTGTFSAAVTAASFVPMLGVGTYGLGLDSSAGLYLRAKSSSTYDFSVVQASGANYVMGVPTGTNNLALLGSLAGTSATFTGQVAVPGTAGNSFKITTPVANGTVATALTALGPTGAATTVQGWLRLNVNGTDHYVPFF